jgi:hypothetical protein
VCAQSSSFVSRYLTWLLRLFRNGLFFLRSSSTELRAMLPDFKPFGTLRGFSGLTLTSFPFLVEAKPMAFRIAPDRPRELPVRFVQFGHVSIFFHLSIWHNVYRIMFDPFYAGTTLAPPEW